MAVTIFHYDCINITEGFRMDCRIDTQEDKTMLQNIFVDLCCRALEIPDLLFGYDDENNEVETLTYPVNKKFIMAYYQSDGNVVVFPADKEID